VAELQAGFPGHPKPISMPASFAVLRELMVNPSAAEIRRAGRIDEA
jgi:hypothetical protein